MIIDDGAYPPLPTLLVRFAQGEQADTIVQEFFPTQDGAGRGAPHHPDAGGLVVVWVGDVVAPSSPPLAAAVVQISDEGDAMVSTAGVRSSAVRGAGARAEQVRASLQARLGHGIIELASARGCTTISVPAEAGPDSGPVETVRRLGLVAVTDSSWSIES